MTAEVTPHHVFFDTAPDRRQSALDADESTVAGPADRVALLEALRDGTGDFLATDHAPHSIAEKEARHVGQPHLDTYGPFVTWLLVEQGFTPGAHRGSSARPIRDVRPAVQQ